MFKSFAWKGYEDLIIYDDKIGNIDCYVSNDQAVSDNKSFIIVPYMMYLEYSKRDMDVAMQLAAFDVWAMNTGAFPSYTEYWQHSEQDKILPKLIPNWKKIASKRDEYAKTMRLLG